MNEMTTAQAAAAEVIRTPESIGTEIRTLQQQARYMTLLYGVEIGRRLKEAKEMLQHGEWGPWLKRETSMSPSSANRFMRLFEEYGADQIGIFGAETNSSTLANLSVSNALRLLAIPEDEREEFAAEHDVEHLSTREMDDLLRARKEAETQRDQAKADAEAARDLLEEAQKELEDIKRDRDDAKKSLMTATRRILDLEHRPVEVAVEVDETAVKKAAEDAKAEARAEIERLEKKLAAAEKKREKAEAAAREAESKVQTAGADAARERDQIAQELEETRRQLRMADTATAQFKVVFGNAQTAMNEMLRLIRESEGESKQRLRTIAQALIKEFGEKVNG